MKVVLATPLYPPDAGGPATDAALLYKELPKEGIDAVVCSFGKVRRLPRILRHVAYAFQLLKAAKGADGIIALDTFSVCLPVAIVARIIRKPFIVRVPGDFAWEQARQRFGVTDSLDAFQKKHYGMQIEIIRSLQRFAVRCTALMVVPSDYFAGIVAQWGIGTERITRIYLGINPEEHAILPTNAPEGKMLFSVGRLVPWKGFSMLIELMADLPEWQLVIAGDGPLRASLEKEAQQLGVGGRVRFTGKLPHTEVLGWYRQADAFVLNTSFESFSFQVLEAMANRAAIITTTAGSLPELIENGVEGVLCEPNDKQAFKEAIASLTRDPEAWQVRKENAKRRASSFTSEASVEAFATIVKKICA